MSTTSAYDTTLSTMRDKLVYASRRKEDLQCEYTGVCAYLETAKEEAQVAIETQRLVQEAAQATLSNLSLKVGTIVTKALKAVLGDSYKFVLDFKIAYGKLAADIYLEKDGKRYDLRRDNGDGVVDIVALALRVAVMCLDRRHMRRLLILDEPCGAVSVNYQPVLGAMIKQLSDMLDLQVIMIASHGSNMQIEGAKVFDSAEFTEGSVL